MQKIEQVFKKVVPRSTSRLLGGIGSLALALFLLEQSASAQGIERQSLAGEDAAASMRQSDTNQPYNLQIGPVTLRVTASVAGAFNDNINVSEYGRQSDFIITPNLDINAKWQATDLNALVFDLGIGYQFYTVHSSDSGMTISPNSNLTFNIFAGDTKIQLFDNFSYQQDPIGVGQLSNVSQFARFQNDAGFKFDWDLDDVIVSLAYDHTNFWVFESAYEYLNYGEDTVTPSFSYKINPTLTAGLSVALSSMRYDQNVQGNSKSVSAGPFVAAQISDNLSLNAQVGWYYANYEQGSLNGSTGNANGPTGSAGLNHRINDVLNESLTGGFEYIPGINSDYTKRGYANYNLAWQATKYINLGGNLWWESLDDSNATFSQNADRYGVGVNLGYAFTDHLSLNAAYQYVLKNSDQSDFSYTQNVASVGLSYHF